MGRNHTPDCHTNHWSGAAGYKIYDPFCPLCQEEAAREKTYILIWSLFSLLMGLLGFCCGVYMLLKGIT